MVLKKRQMKFGLRLKLVVFVTLLATVTYSTSAFFMYVVSDYTTDLLNESTFTILTLGLGVFWSGVLAFVAAGFVTTPLKHLEQAVKRAADGEIGEDVVLSKSNDEVRSLGLAFNDMLSSLRLMVSNIEMNFTSTTTKVAEIERASKSATEQAELMSSAIDSIAKGADQSAASVQETAEAFENVMKIAEDVQEKAVLSEQQSITMIDSLKETDQIIHSLIKGFNKQVESSYISLDAVKSLDQKAKEVEDIISLVGNIAKQTNLLALNAAIEAARAGEHGKGFSVVATEVRSLADGSSRAVEDISNLIRDIQTEVKEVVIRMTEQVDIGNKEAEKGKMTDAAIKSMTGSVYEFVDSVKQIATLADHQMDSIRETASLSQEVAAIAEETSAGTEEMSASSVEQAKVIQNIYVLTKEFTQQAEQLKKTIERFTV
nr:HAMP domain-containing methyl-accepting chemotaxis protein [Litchfieldia alkalitelluris]